LDLDEINRAELSSFTKEVGNKLLNSYERHAKRINDQRCENLRLQLEINYLVKEKNGLDHDLKNLTNTIGKLEKYLGVKVINDDCNEKNARIEQAMFENKTKYHINK